MINPSAVLGLENTPAYDNLKQIKAGIEVLVQHKARDYESERRHFKQEKEQDKREKQDLKFIQEREAKEIIKFQKFMKSKEGGLTAALLGGAALLGALTLIGALDIPKMVGDIWNKLKEMFGFGPSTKDQEEVEEAAENPPAEGDVSAMEPAEQEGSGTPLKMPPGVSKGSPIGMRRHPVHGTMKHHNGVDIPAPTGTPLTIRGNGKFVSSGFEKGYGNWVVIKDQRGEHFYSHLSKFGKFKAGDSIKTGDIVGYVGTTGTSTGPHLHWEFDTTPGLVGNQRPPSKVMDPYANGYTHKTPFTGLQSGGAVGKATHYIRDHESLGSLTPGKWDWVKPKAGALSFASKTPWEKVNNNTPIYPYRDRGAKKTPTIGWGTTFLGGMMSGANPVTMQTPPMPKKKADEHLTKDVASLTAHLAKTISYWKHLTESQKAGFISIGYNAGQNAHITKSTAKFFPYRDAVQSGNLNKVISPDVMPHYHNEKRQKRRKEEIGMLKQGPMDYSKYVKKQRGGRVGKQGGGIVNLYHQMMPKSNHRFYNQNFFLKQGKKGRGSVVIVVNNSSSGGYGGGSAHSDLIKTVGMVPTTPVNYTDISQTYYRYIRGIRS